MSRPDRIRVGDKVTHVQDGRGMVTDVVLRIPTTYRILYESGEEGWSTRRHLTKGWVPGEVQSEDADVVMTPHHEARCANPGCAGYLLKGKDGVWRHSDAAEHPESENALHVPLRRKT
jgi:hypothetical protein